MGDARWRSRRDYATERRLPWLQRNARKALLISLTNSELAKQSVWLSGITGGLPGFASKLLQGDPGESELPMKLPVPSSAPELPAVVPSVGKRRARVALLTGCVMKALYSDVHWDTVKVLAANGCEVLIRPNQGCCGALHLHQGFGDQAIELASSVVAQFGPINGIDAIIVNSAGCGSTVKEYSTLLKNAPNAANAGEFGRKCKDVTEFLDELGWVADLKPLPLTVTYHDACHLAMAQRITAPPRKLLARIPEMNLVDLEEGDVCCGSAGVYNVTEPSMARRLQGRKVQRILDTGASVVATGNPGCMAWISDGLGQKNIRVVHPVTLLREALT